MSVVHPIERAWITTGGTGAQNYDEFADESEITEIIRANPASALAIEMPHRAPDSLGKPFADALPDAVTRLTEAKQDGSYTPAERVVVLYRISASGDEPSYGLFCLVDTDQISASAGEPGLVIRNEDVFIDKVRERIALAEATGHLLSAVLLLQTARADDLHAALAAACDGAGAPAATDVDRAGRTHAIWPLRPGPAQDELLALAGGGELVVADGNHRTLAAQLGGLRRFLAVVTTARSVAIQPYNRLVSELTIPLDELVARFSAPGTIYLYGGQQRGYAVDLGPRSRESNVVDNLDHALVERVLFRDALGLDPGDKRITYVGGDYPMSWLAGEVDAGRAELAVLIPPVTVEDFVAVNLARQKMPRKSTWFMPKARAGMVLVEIASARSERSEPRSREAKTNPAGS
jgi:uncharacterized protein (DUF1015 family)